MAKNDGFHMRKHATTGARFRTAWNGRVMRAEFWSDEIFADHASPRCGVVISSADGRSFTFKYFSRSATMSAAKPRKLTAVPVVLVAVILF